MAVKIVCVVSNLKTTMKTHTYTVWNGGEVTGAHTNEAPIRALLRTAQQAGRPVEEVLMLATDLARESMAYTVDGQASEGTVQKYLTDSIETFCRQEQIPVVPETIVIPCSFDRFDCCLNDLLCHVNEGDKLYIDTTGGQRDAVNWMVLSMQILKYAKVTISCIAYSVFDAKDPAKNRVEEKKDQYRGLDLMQAVEEFTACGRAEKLDALFKNSSNESVKQLCANMKKFTDALAMCRTRNIADKICDIQQGMRQLKNEPVTGMGANEQLFQAVLPLLERNFIAQEAAGLRQIQEMIRWCCKAGLGMPALALFRETFPDILAETELLYPSEELKQKMAAFPKLSGNPNAAMLDMILYRKTLNDFRNQAIRSVQEQTLQDPLAVVEYLNEANGAYIITVLPKEDLRKFLCYYHFLRIMRNTVMHAGVRPDRLFSFEVRELALPSRLEDVGSSTVCNAINAVMNLLEKAQKTYGNTARHQP